VKHLIQVPVGWNVVPNTSADVKEGGRLKLVSRKYGKQTNPDPRAMNQELHPEEALSSGYPYGGATW
jgi:hypothetical protein